MKHFVFEEMYSEDSMSTYAVGKLPQSSTQRVPLAYVPLLTFDFKIKMIVKRENYKLL